MVAMSTGPPTDLTQKIHCVLFLALDVQLERQRGDAVHTRELAAEFGNLGLKVCLVTSTPEPMVPRMGANVIHRTCPNVGVMRLTIWLSKLASQIAADIIYERRFSPKVGLGTKALCGTPLVVEINGLVDEERVVQGRPPLASAGLRKWWHGTLFHFADGIVAVTNGIRDVLVNEYGVSPLHIEVVPNGANVTVFRPKDRRICREALGLSDAPLVSFVGELAPWQGVDSLVRAAILLKTRITDVAVMVVGDGMNRSSIRSLVEDTGAPVHLVGRIAHKEIPTYLGAADVVVIPKLPLRSGYSPLKLYEALASGRAVVASREPGLEFIEKEEVGVLVPSNNPEALADALAQILMNPNRRLAIESRARTLAETSFSWNQTARRVLRAMEKFHAV